MMIAPFRNAALLLTCLMSPNAGSAQSPAGAFYAGKTIEVLVGYAPGGSNDLYARAVIRHLGRFIPGAPNMLARNMPGAGSKAAANHLYNVAPRDGTVLALLAATIPLEGVLGGAGVRYDPTKYNWIGRIGSSMNVTMMRSDSPVKKIEDAFGIEATLSSTTAGGPIYLFPYVMNALLGTKFKIILGYNGTAQAMLAMERGETDGHSTAVEAVKLLHPQWISGDIKVRPIVQYGLNKHPDLPDVPLAIDFARSADHKAILRAIMSAAEVGKSVVAGPSVPSERVEILRAGFSSTLSDVEFRQELTSQRVGIEPMSGTDLQKYIQEIASLPPELLAQLKTLYAE